MSVHAAHPVRRQQVLLALTGAVLAIAVAGVLYLNWLTAGFDLVALEVPNNIDADKAGKKLELFEAARDQSRKGYIRLTEVELNSYVFKLLSQRKALLDSGQASLEKCRVQLGDGEITFYSWIRLDVWGHHREIVWQRTFGIEPTAAVGEFELKEMRIGQATIPASLWSRVEEWLGSTDMLVEQYRGWWKEIPHWELADNPYGHRPEIHLYTYSPLKKLANKR